MTLGELMAQFRADVDDAKAPPLWSDASVIRWMNEAEQEACRRSELLIDSTTVALTPVTAVAADAWVAYDPRIVAVKRARPQGQYPIPVITAKEMDGYQNWEDETGPLLRALVSDMATFKFRTYPVLTANATIDLTVQRLPLADMVEPEEDSPEIAVVYHLKLLHWVKHRAYSVDDVDANDPRLASKYEADFIREFGTATARQEAWIRAHGGRDPVTGTFA